MNINTDLKNEGGNINVLSLFDGDSGGQVALKKAGFSIGKYYASEIDKYAIQITQKNHPNTIQIGDVVDVKGSDYPDTDIIIGGSPCQGFSYAGKKLNFIDPRSRLFFEFVRVLEELRRLKPGILFLLENVKMEKEFQDIISKYLGIEPIKINSSTISAQNRERLYWTNISAVSQPDDKGLLLKDIIENLNGNRPCDLREYKKSSLCHHIATATDIKGNESIKRVYAVTGKSPTLTTMQGGHRQPKVLCENSMYRKLTPLECERLQTLPDNYTEGVSNTQRYKMIGNGWTIDVVAHIFTFFLKQRIESEVTGIKLIG